MEKLTLENICHYLPYGLKLSVNTFYNTPDNEAEDNDIELGSVVSTFDSVNRSENQWIGLTFDCKEGLRGRNTMFNKNWRVYRDYYTPDRVKPILCPMDLTKPIQVEGKEIIPIVELAKIAGFICIGGRIEVKGRIVYHNGDIAFCYNTENGAFSYERISSAANDFDIAHTPLNQYPLFQWLFKHKFDAFGLIEKGLAIDVNTLENNPYESC